MSSNTITNSWEADYSKSEFIKYAESDHFWYERDENKNISYIFIFVKSLDGDVILYDANRRIFIRISIERLFWGSDIDNINNFLLNGKWTLNHPSWYMLI